MAEQKTGLVGEFKEFLLRGNVVDLAIAVVIGTAFALVIKAFVSDMLTPIISIFAKKTTFQDLVITVRGSRFQYGDFLNAAITFVITAAIVFFFVVAPINYMMERHKRAVEDGETPPLSEEVVLLKEIRDLLASKS